MDLELPYRLADLAPGEPTRFEQPGLALCIVRAAKDADDPDQVYVVDDECSHADTSLSEGFVDGTVIECWMHGACFDLRTGEVTSPPATEAIRSYPVTVADGRVVVTIEDGR